jgi:hypothetical protein
MIYNYKYNCGFDSICSYGFLKYIFLCKTRQNHYGEDDTDSGVLGQFPPRHIVLPDK